MSIKGPKIAWHRVSNESQDTEKGHFDIRFAEIIDKKQDDFLLLRTENTATENNPKKLNSSENNSKIQKTNSINNNNSTNSYQFEEFTVEVKDPNYINYAASQKSELKKIYFRSKFFDFLKNNSIKYLLLKLKNYYSKFIISYFERLSNNSDRKLIEYLFNEKPIESLKLLDYDDSHPLGVVEPEQISTLKRIHYRVDNSNKSFAFLEKAIKPVNSLNNSLHTLIIETNQFSKLKEIFNDFGRNFQNLINLHIYLMDKPSITFEEIIKNLTSKLDYIKSNRKKFVVGKEENKEIRIPFKNLTFRNFTHKAKIDTKVLLEFFKKMTPAEFGAERFDQCFEKLNLTQSTIDDQNDDLAKLVNGYRMIKVLNISNVT